MHAKNLVSVAHAKNLLFQSLCNPMVQRRVLLASNLFCLLAERQRNTNGNIFVPRINHRRPKEKKFVLMCN